MKLVVQHHLTVLRVSVPAQALDRPTIVNFISHHVPTNQQIEAMLQLQKTRAMEIRCYHDIVFHSAENFVSLLKESFSDAFCYVVAPQEFLTAAMEANLEFGSFIMSNKRHRLILEKVFHYAEGRRELIFRPQTVEARDSPPTRKRRNPGQWNNKIPA